MSKRQRTRSNAKATPDPIVIVAKTTAPDGTVVEIAKSPILRCYEELVVWLEATGRPVPPRAVADWIERYSAIGRVNGGSWERIDQGDVDSAAIAPVAPKPVLPN